jgi:hypothetical protein
VVTSKHNKEGVPGGLLLGQVDSKENRRSWKVCLRVFLSHVRASFCSKELGINFSHIQAKSMTVLNPLSHVDEHIMDDADLAGPAFYCFCFGTCLLLVRITVSPTSDN